MSAREIPEWVKPGTEVVIVNSGGWGKRYRRITKIDKVYKTGRFIIDGESQQWRPWNDYACQTGSSYYSSTRCEPITDEVRAEMDREKRVYAARTVVREESERLEKLSRGDSDELLAEADRIRSLIPEAPQPEAKEARDATE